MFTYRATLIRVIDGDTLVIRIDLGLSASITTTVRLYGPDPAGKDAINAPELGTKEGRLSRDYLVALLPTDANALTVTTIKDRKEKYGRYLAVVSFIGRDMTVVNVAQRLLDGGHARLTSY